MMQRTLTDQTASAILVPNSFMRSGRRLSRVYTTVYKIHQPWGNSSSDLALKEANSLTGTVPEHSKFAG